MKAIKLAAIGLPGKRCGAPCGACKRLVLPVAGVRFGG
jgi:hypothetical protein